MTQQSVRGYRDDSSFQEPSPSSSFTPGGSELSESCNYGNLTASTRRAEDILFYSERTGEEGRVLSMLNAAFLQGRF